MNSIRSRGFWKNNIVKHGTSTKGACPKPSTNYWPRWSFILILALILRCIFAFAYEIPIYTDMEGYHKLGLQLSRGWLNGHAYYPPLYPTFLALIYFLFGPNYLLTRVVQAFISAFSCVLIYRIGHLCFDEKVGFYSALVACFYFPFIAFSGVLMSENQFVFCLLLAIYTLLRFQKSKRKKDLIIAGLAGGLALLTRGNFLAFLPLIFIWLAMVFPHQWRLTGQHFILYFLILCLTITPALVRNYLIYQRPMFISYNGAVNLALGSGVSQLEKENIRRQLEDKNLPPIAEQKVFYKLAIERIKENPWRYIKAMGGKLRKLYLESYFYPFYPSTNTIYWLLKFSQLFFIFILIPLTFVSLRFLPLEKYTSGGLLLGVIILNSIFYLFFFGRARFRLPTDPYFIILAIYSTLQLLTKFSSQCPSKSC